MEEPKISVARAFADSFLPQTKEGRLYKAIGLPEPWRKWRDGAPVTMEVFDKMGVNIGVYMRLVYGCIPLFFFLSIVSLVPICYNLAGTYEVDNTLLSAHTLGNARQLLALQGVFDFICVITMMAAIAKGTQVLRDASERIEPRRANQLSAANYTLLVRGLPRSNQLQASELRALFEHWGEVVSVAIARANSALIKLVRERQDLSFKLTQKRICASRLHKKAKTPQERAAAAARGAPSPKDERRLQYLNGEIGKLRKEVFPSTGICFVTFNEQRAAHACLLKLRERPQASIAGEFVNLQAEFAPSPDNLIWENLEVGACSRWLRRWLVNSILIVQCIVSTLAITAVTNRSVEKGLDDTAGFFEKIFTTAWTTVIIILSNLSIFILAPIYMDKIERDHTQDLRETALAGKLLIFQVFNGMAAALSFLWTKDGGIKGIFDHEWYSVGAPTVINVLIADALIINLAVEGFRIFDALPIRLLLAPRARTQAEMNKLYAVTNPLYLPFRMQLTLKFFVFGIGFAYGIPVLYPLTLLFFLVSWVTDRSGLLRVFHGILVTTDKLVILLGMIDTCPWALVLHCFLAFLMAHSFEVAEQQLTPDGGAFVAFRELDQTVPNFSVGLSLALLGLSLLFALVFVTREKAIRRARKERRLRLFSRLPKLGTPAFAQLKSKFKVKMGRSLKLARSVSKMSSRETLDTLVPASADIVASHGESNGDGDGALKPEQEEVALADLVPFRELHAYGVSPKLYIPPLTATMLAGFSDQLKLRKRQNDDSFTVTGTRARVADVELNSVEIEETRPSAPSTAVIGAPAITISISGANKVRTPPKRVVRRASRELDPTLELHPAERPL